MKAGISLSPLLGLGTSGGVGGRGCLPAAAAAAAAGAPLSLGALLLAAARFREDERGGARRAAVGVLLRGGRTLREIVL